MSRIKNDKKRPLDTLSALDFELIRRGRANANELADWFLRSPTSGTYWQRVPVDPTDAKPIEAWKRMFDAWQAANLPDEVFSYMGRDYRVLWDENQYPIFWDHHGWLFQPWQLKAFHVPQPEHTIIGGFASGKTAYIAGRLAINAMSLPNYRGFAVAPQMIQAMEVFKYINSYFAETPWMERFVWVNRTKPYPMFELRNNYIGTSSIEILSIESDPEKVLTLEGDELFLDQAEKMPELDDLVRGLGTRLRGQIHGRQKLGRLTFVANAGDNDELWQRYNMAEYEPTIFYSYNPASYENMYLTKRDIENLERRVGGSRQDIEQWIEGKRPPGKGVVFSSQAVKRCTDESLDHMMDDQIEAQATQTTVDLNDLEAVDDLFIKRTEPGLGIYHWEMPPDFRGGAQYVVIGDPGQGNPPHRNSPVLMVWDVKDFPARPATLRAFKWVFGNGSYEPFLADYTHYVRHYHAHGRNGFDSTGTQKGFDELYFANYKIYPTGLNMAGSGKFHAINAAVFFLGKSLMRFPYLSHMQNQLTTYALPDTKLKQDIVACFIMSAMFIQQYFWVEIPDGSEDEQPTPLEPIYERNSRLPRSRTSRRFAR